MTWEVVQVAGRYSTRGAGRCLVGFSTESRTTTEGAKIVKWPICRVAALTWYGLLGGVLFVEHVVVPNFGTASGVGCWKVCFVEQQLEWGQIQMLCHGVLADGHGTFSCCTKLDHGVLEARLGSPTNRCRAVSDLSSLRHTLREPYSAGERRLRQWLRHERMTVPPHLLPSPPPSPRPLLRGFIWRTRPARAEL